MRLPLGTTDSHLLYGLPSPYVSLGSSTSLGVPWAASLGRLAAARSPA